MYLGNPLIPAAAAFLREEFGRGESVHSIDWSDKAAVLGWLRLRTANGARLSDNQLASLPDELLSDLDFACALADVQPALLSKCSRLVLSMPDVAKRAVASDAGTASLFPADTLRMAGLQQPSARPAAQRSEFEQAIEAVRTRPMALGEFSLAIRNDPEVVSLAASIDPAALAYASTHLWADPHFIKQNLPADPQKAARVLGALVRVRGDSGAARLISNRHVAAILATRSADASLPPKTREVIERAYQAAAQRRTPLSRAHPGARPGKPTPFDN